MSSRVDYGSYTNALEELSHSAKPSHENECSEIYSGHAAPNRCIPCYFFCCNVTRRWIKGPRLLRAAVSFVFADDFTPVKMNFEISVRPNNGPGEAEKPWVTATFSGTSIKEDKKVLDVSIDQLQGVKDVKVTSSSMSKIRFLTLVVNSDVFVEEKTRFKSTWMCW